GTRVAATTARAIVATDFNPGPLEIARAKGLGSHVRFEQADAFALPDYAMAFDAGMAPFWWSHVTLADQQRFLAHFASKLRPGANLLMMDNTHVPDSSGPVSRTDAAGNTYQLRTLASGETYEGLKNLHTAAELRAALATLCTSVDVLQLTYYWALSGTLA